jgi:hypothetical protein
MPSRIPQTAGHVTRLKRYETNMEFWRGSLMQGDYMEGRGDESSVIWWITGKWDVSMGGGWNALDHSLDPMQYICESESALLSVYCRVLKKARKEETCYLLCCTGRWIRCEDVSSLQPQLCVRRFASECKREWCAQLQHVGKSPPNVDTVTCGPVRCEKCNFDLPLHKHVLLIKIKATRSFEAWITTYLPMLCDVPENRNSKLQF